LRAPQQIFCQAVRDGQTSTARMISSARTCQTTTRVSMRSARPRSATPITCFRTQLSPRSFGASRCPCKRLKLSHHPHVRQGRRPEAGTIGSRAIENTNSSPYRQGWQGGRTSTLLFCHINSEFLLEEHIVIVAKTERTASSLVA
jgi:hypothetical protein